MPTLKYAPLEKLPVSRTVGRIAYIRQACAGKNVLDLGCYDETALSKRDSGNYLFSEISSVAAIHIGVDNSKLLPPGGLHISDTEKILFGDIFDLDQMDFGGVDFDIIVAGELIEHLPNSLQFFANMKKSFPGKRLICSTPNATSFANMILSVFKRESAHIDHLQVYSYKTLNTLCRTVNFSQWQIIPYHIKFTEMIVESKGIKKHLVNFSESMVNGFETLFPLTSGGYIIDIVI